MREITGGKGVPVVCDSIEKDTFIGSLDFLAPLGSMVSFANASGGGRRSVSMSWLSRGSLTIMRASLLSYISTRADLDAAVADLFQMVDSKQFKSRSISTSLMHMKDMAQANADLDNPMNHPQEPPTGSDGSPKFGRFLIVLVVILIGLLCNVT